MIDAQVALVLQAAPGFVDRYLDLAEAADGDPGMAATFTELADYVAGLVAEIERCTPLLTRCLEAVEAVASSGRGGGVGVPRQPLPRRPETTRTVAGDPHARPVARGRCRARHHRLTPAPRFDARRSWRL
jgi:hypothetical protein